MMERRKVRVGKTGRERVGLGGTILEDRRAIEPRALSVVLEERFKY